MDFKPILKKGINFIFSLIFILALGIASGFLIVVISEKLSPGLGVSHDARIVADMNQIRSSAFIMYETKGSYAELDCNLGDIKTLCNDIGQQSGFKPVIFLNEKKDKYCVVAKSVIASRCVDSGLYAGSGSCDDQNFVCSKDAPVPLSFSAYSQNLREKRIQEVFYNGLIILILAAAIFSLVKIFKKRAMAAIIFFILVVFFIFIIVGLSGARKPAIYLYPREDSFVSVKLGIKGIITRDIPKYKNGWNVFVTKEGLIDKKYDYLFYEALLFKVKLPDSGWIVKYEKLNQWFEDNLIKLGLNEKEKSQFVEYWLKVLPKVNYYQIKLAEKEFLEENMALDISPKPDTEIRLLFDFKPLKKEIILKEPEITTPERIGFTVVEWGGILER